MIGEGRPLLPEVLGQSDRFEAKLPIFDLFFARSASAITPSNNFQLTLIGSPLSAFQRAQNEHRTLSLRLPKGCLKNAKCPQFEQ